MTQKSGFIKNGLPAMLGTAIEQYDVALYGYMAPILVEIFLPDVEKVNALIIYFALEILALLAQPMGAFVFGRMGDKSGRKQSLYASIMGTAISTGLISLIPAYSNIGYYAAVVFIMLRILQNFFLGGEYNGGAIFCLEHARDSNRKCLVSGLYCAFTVFGIMIAALATTLISHFGKEYWRIAYAFSFFTSIFVFYLRRQMKETPEFLAPGEPQVQISERRYGNLLCLIAITIFFGVIYGLPTKVFNSILPLAIGIDVTQLMYINTILLFLYMLLLVTAGYLADIVGSKRIMLSAAIAGCILTYPLIIMVKGGTINMIIFAKFMFVLITAGLIAPFHAWAKDLFSTHQRYTYISLGFTLGKIIYTALLSFAIWSWKMTDSFHVIAVIIIVCAALASSAVIFAKSKA